MMKNILSLLVVASLSATTFAQDTYIAYPDRSQLLVLRDANGGEQPITHSSQWSQRVKHIRAGMEQVMGPLPDRNPRGKRLMELVSQEDAGEYTRRKIKILAVETWVPAWLLVPKVAQGGQRLPAMLCLHQTTSIGKDEPAGLGGKPSLHYAHELAKRGYVCLVPDYPSFGEYPCDFKQPDNKFVSGTMMAIRNNMCAVDLLQTFPEVEPTAIGVIGHSLGGHNALFTAVFDERLKAVVTSCGYTPFHDYYGGKVAGWTSDRYMPRIRDVYENNADRIPFDFYEILGAIAPRGIYSCSPTRDSNFDINGVRKAVAAAGQVYELFGAKDKLVLDAPEAEHDFPEAQRQAAYEWLDKLLK